jgi:antitoxin component of MazEF toxin-antitoxin module
MQKWVTKVVSEDGALGILIPEALMKELNLLEGELLEWSVNEDYATMRKIKIVDNNKITE